MPVLTNFELSTSKIKCTYKKCMQDFDAMPELDRIFEIALSDLTLFPNINGAKSCTTYIYKWIDSYAKEIQMLPSEKIAEAKKTCSDPAIFAIIKGAMNIDNHEVLLQSKHHDLFMSAENIQGALLEEYIANNICCYGWLWCRANVLHAVDFCRSSHELLQIKNKSNTENSSSSQIRVGTSIQKWFRLKTATKNKKPQPCFMWQNLNAIINNCNDAGMPVCCMSEEDYSNFLDNVSRNNPHIITSQ